MKEYILKYFLLSDVHMKQKPLKNSDSNKESQDETPVFIPKGYDGIPKKQAENEYQNDRSDSSI